MTGSSLLASSTQTTWGDFGEMTRAGGFTPSPGLVFAALRRARRKPSSSRPRHFAVPSKPRNGAARGRGDRRLISARCRDAPAPKASGRPTSKARSFRAAKVARARGNKSGAEVKAARPRAAQKSFQVVAAQQQQELKGSRRRRAPARYHRIYINPVVGQRRKARR